MYNRLQFKGRTKYDRIIGYAMVIGLVNYNSQEHFQDVI